jgi:1,4-dihydroxy-2-naphthoate octaprenyltransferase
MFGRSFHRPPLKNGENILKYDSKKPSAFSAWILAARPKTLTAAAVPVIVGTSFARADGFFALAPTLLCFGFAFLMQICANFINDLIDFKKGADSQDRIGPKRACAQGWISPQKMLCGIIVAAMAAAICGCCLLFFGGLGLVFVGFACLLFAYLYTGGPFPLSSHGLGDVAVIVFFGIVPVCFTYYIMAHCVTIEVAIASLACGLVVDTLLVLNNYRDRLEDAQNDKRTTVVIFGARAGRAMYLCFGVAACLLCAYFWTNIWGAVLPQIYLPLHAATWSKMISANTTRNFDSALAETSRNMLIFALLLGIGAILPSPF